MTGMRGTIPAGAHGTVEYAGLCLPAAGAETGGDWWDAVPRPDGSLLLAIGDAEGHGPAAAPAARSLASLVRAVSAEGHGLDLVMAAARRRASRLGLMATLFLAVLEDRVGPTLRYGSAGHPPALVVSGGAVKALPLDPGPPLGSGWAGEELWGHWKLSPGDALVLHTDGLCGPDGLASPSLVASMRRVGTDLQARGLCAVALGSQAGDGDDRTVLALRAGPAVCG